MGLLSVVALLAVIAATLLAGNSDDSEPEIREYAAAPTYPPEPSLGGGESVPPVPGTAAGRHEPTTQPPSTPPPIRQRDGNPPPVGHRQPDGNRPPHGRTVPGRRTTPPRTAAPRPGRPATTAPRPAATCRVSYSANTWNNGFVTNITISNTGGSAVNGWSLGWTFGGDQWISNIWNATAVQSGGRVTARNMPYNPAIAPGGRVDLGFQASYSGTNASPTRFTLNGAACDRG